MTQEERSVRLIQALLSEQPERYRGLSVPAEPEARRRLLRALFNVREPMPAAPELLRLQDAYLQTELARKVVTDGDALPELAPGLCLWRGDITTLECDAIVNAANSALLGCFCPNHGCIDNAIHTFAGVQLRIECARLMDEQGYAEPTGMAKVTDAFNLPSRYIIHTVGPIAQGAPSDLDRALLANCYTACLDAADELGCESIAFCCISTGVFGFPQEQAAPIAVRTVEEWLDAHPDTPVKRVIFNVFSERDEKVYERLLA